MSRPIALSDDELEAVMNAARPLSPLGRDRFLKAVAQAIAALPEVGPGSVHRAIASVWRQHYDPPDLRLDQARSRVY